MKLRVTPTVAPLDLSTQKTFLKVAASGDPEDPMAKEMRVLYNRPLRYNNNLPALQVARMAAEKTGTNPALLFSSAFQEGFNKAIARPDDVSDAYTKAFKGGSNPDFPVDGFYNYGLDRFSENYEKLKKYLPQGFEQRFTPYDAINEKKEKIKTAAFRTDEDALIAKGAVLRGISDSVDTYAKQRGVTLDDDAKNYFMLAAYNAGEGNAQKMLDSYVKAKDKKAFIEKGDVNWQKIHHNISPRMANMKIATELLNSK